MNASPRSQAASLSRPRMSVLKKVRAGRRFRKSRGSTARSRISGGCSNPMRAVNRGDDPRAPQPELPQALQLSPQERPHGRVVAEGAKGVPHAALQVGVQAADDVGNVWRDDESVSSHLPTPLVRRSERLTK